MTYCAPVYGRWRQRVAGRANPCFAASPPCLGLMDARGEPIWTVSSPILDFRGQTDEMRVSQDGNVVDFGYG